MVKFVYCGYNKTGITSIATLFKKLNYKVWDYDEQLVYCHEGWLEIFNPTTTPERIRELIFQMYQNVDVVTDVPLFFYWREVEQVFPDCKFIFYERPIDKWWKSWVNQHKTVFRETNRLPDIIQYTILGNIFRYVFRFDMMKKYNDYNDQMYLFWFNNELKPRRKLFQTQPYVIPELISKKNYQAYNADFLTNCPKHKQLVIKKYGDMDEFCSLIGIDKPDFDFPRENTTENNDKLKKLASRKEDFDHPLRLYHLRKQGDRYLKITLCGLVAIISAIIYWILM